MLVVCSESLFVFLSNRGVRVKVVAPSHLGPRFCGFTRNISMYASIVSLILYIAHRMYRATVRTFNTFSLIPSLTLIHLLAHLPRTRYTSFCSETLVTLQRVLEQILFGAAAGRSAPRDSFPRVQTNSTLFVYLGFPLTGILKSSRRDYDTTNR